MTDEGERPVEPSDTPATPSFHVAGLVPTGPAIVTGRFSERDGYTYDGYVRTGGYQALRKALAMTPEQVHEEVKTAEIQGRGGAGFPAGTKWGFTPPDVWPRYVVVNGDESEPGTYKDRMLMELDPHQLIEGTLIACYAIKASQAFLYVRGEMALAQERIAQALNDAYANGLVGKKILGSDFSVDVTLTWGAGAYIVGEETALIESLEGGRGVPRLKPPYFPAAKGLYMQPTIVNNVETLANLPWIITNGGAAFKSTGAPTSTGMRMFAVSGHVNRPGVFEVPNGITTFRQLFEAPEYCGGIRDGGELKAFIPGGASAMWFFPEHVDLPLDKGTVDKAGSMLGSGAIVVMDQTTDIVKACWRIVRFFARESCGKCTPCREGTTWLERILARMIAGHGRRSDLDLLLDVSDNISPGLTWPPRQTTICPLGPSAVSPIVSGLNRCRDEFEAYLERSDALDVPTEREAALALAVAHDAPAATKVELRV
jgi:NADH-quinone oxidoreductase subunit F